jgi:hypothetical protein
MKKKACLGVLCGVLLFAASPALAAIVYSLENPSNGQFISGISTISGWAFAQSGAPVNVELLVNGQPTNITIPCCGPRADVQAQNPQAPLDTAFGLLLNYGIFDPITLKSIGVQLTAANESPVTINQQVILAKPGAQASDPSPALFSFLEQLSPSKGRAAVDGEEIIVAPVTVADNDSGGTRKSTLRLLWTSNSQSFGIIRAASGTSFDGVQAIFDSKCATAQCHDHTTAVAGLDLSSKKSFTKTVAIRSNTDPLPQQRFFVNPSKVLESYLYQKIIANGNSIAGTRMPPDCASNANSCLSDAEVQTIFGWIDEGAPPPQQ